MVFFVCNSCGESLKKAKVDSHKFRCNFQTVSCSDCSKDFTLQTSKAHVTCVTEDEKYGGLNYQKKNNQDKNKKRQQDWVDKLQKFISETQIDPNLKPYLNKLKSYTNIPRKKIKFVNFSKTSLNIKNDEIIDKIWEIFENLIKNQENLNSNNSNNKREALDDNNNLEIKKLKLETNSEELSKPEEENNLVIEKEVDTNVEDNKNKAFENDDKIQCVINNLKQKSDQTNKFINLTKFTKKILKRQQDKQLVLKKFKKLLRGIQSYTKFNNLPLLKYYENVMNILSNKDHFKITDKKIIYKINEINN